MIASQPGAVGLPKDMTGEIEFRFPSGDRADIVFSGPLEVVVAEIELEGLFETMCGLFQAVKYLALMEAMLTLRGDNRRVRALLVANSVPQDVKACAKTLGIEVHEVDL
jgi:hypothetical protein